MKKCPIPWIYLTWIWSTTHIHTHQEQKRLSSTTQETAHLEMNNQKVSRIPNVVIDIRIRPRQSSDGIFLVGPTTTQKFYGNLFDPTPPHSHPTPKKYGLIKGLASNNHDPLITYWGLFSWLVAWGWTGVSLGKAQNKIISWPRRDDLQWDLGKTMVIYRDHSPLGCYPATAKLKESGNGVDWSYGSYTISSTQQKRRCLNQWNVVPKLYKIPQPNIAPEKWPNPKRCYVSFKQGNSYLMNQFSKNGQTAWSRKQFIFSNPFPFGRQGWNADLEILESNTST